MRNSLILAASLTLGLGVGAAACSDDPATPAPGNSVRGEVHAVFVGNSLTYTHDVPGLVHTIAEVAGESFSANAVAFPNVSLEDQWVSGPAQSVIMAERPDVVVLQQGPSSLPQNQELLRVWAQRFADLARQSGGEPGLYMVWPESTRMGAFDAVSVSYPNAAAAVDGLLFPAGEAWRAVWRRAPAMELYGPDGFHPSQKGAVEEAVAAFGRR